MWLRTHCDIEFEVFVPTPFILMLRPRNTGQQWTARESYNLKPSVPVYEYTDTYGNHCQRLVAPEGRFSIHTSADIHTQESIEIAPGAPFNEIQTLPDDVLTYLIPSRYCEAERFTELSRTIVGDAEPGYDQVATVNQWLRDNILFNPLSQHFQMSAVEVHNAGEGVCREITHLGIALCRSLCIPARMVVGYLYGLKPMDFHAWFEAYVGGRWYTFDPTQSEPKGGRIVVAYGHDASDVAVFTQFGPSLYPSYMAVGVTRLADPED